LAAAGARCGRAGRRLRPVERDAMKLQGQGYDLAACLACRNPVSRVASTGPVGRAGRRPHSGRKGWPVVPDSRMTAGVELHGLGFRQGRICLSFAASVPLGKPRAGA